MHNQTAPLHILIVEDDDTDFFIIREFIRDIKNQNFIVQQCSRYAEALEIIPKKLYDIYFIDYRLGAKTGLDLLQSAIDNNCEEPMILLTGKGNAIIDQEAMRIGAADYLIKSEINSENLERSIRYALSRAQTLKALRASEKKYRTIFENSYDAIFITDTDLALKDLNPASSRLFDYPPSRLLEMNLLDFIKSEKTKTRITNELLISGVVHDLETEITGGGGEVRNCILSLSRHSVENNEVHLHGIIHDITELKKIEKATVQAEKLAATWRLARTLAHEVRNPLSTIQMSVEQLEDLSNGDEHGLFLDIIKRNADRINRLITQLLESSGQLEIQVELVDLQKVIEETVQLAKDRINLKNIKVKVESLLPPFLISAHPEKLKIALLNILVNAIDAVEPAEGVIMIRLLKDENACKIILEDNGCGIPKENLGNLFEPYFTSKKNGMGLGLAMTLNIVKAHLGEIEVISEVDKGTNFIITLPLIKDTLKHERQKQINL